MSDDAEKIRQNIAAYKAAIEAGTHQQKDLDDYLSEVHEARTGKPFVNPPPDTSETLGDKAAGAISAAYQGATFGAGNKITAAIRTVLPEKLGGVKGFDYPTALKEQTDVLDQFRERHPVASSAVELAGGLATAIPGGIARGAVGAGKMARIGTGAAKGAAAGGAYGALNAIRPDATAGDVVEGGMKGATLGGVTGGLLSTGGVVADAVRNAPKGTARAWASEIPGVNRAERIGRKVQALREAEAKAAAPVAEKAPGFIGNTTDNLADAAAARSTAAMSPRRALTLDDELERLVAPAERTLPQQTEGFVGNSMDNVLEAVKANKDQRLFDALSREVRAVDDVTAVPWKPQRARGATKERDAYWVERMGRRKP